VLSAGSKSQKADGSTAPATFLFTRRKLIGVSALGATVGAGGWLATRSVRHNAARPVRVVIQLPERTAAADPGRLLGPPVVAPNGDALVVTLQNPTGTCLYVRPLDADRLIRLADTEGASFPFWSPDGQKVAFFADDKLKYVPALGGSATVLCGAHQARGGAWSKKGIVLFSAVRGERNRQEISLVQESGGNPKPLTYLNLKAGENSHRYPQILRDGNQFLYFSRSDSLDVRGIYLTSVDQRNRRTRLSVADGLFAIGSAGKRGATYLLSQQAGKLVAQELDPKRGVLMGAYHTVMDHPASFSISKSGILAARTEEQELSQLFWRDRNGREIEKLDPAGDYWSISLSPDDRFIAVIRHNFLNGEFTGWISRSTPVSFESLSSSRHVNSPFWLADTGTVCYTDTRRQCLLCRTADLKGEETPILSLAEGVEVQDISPNRQFVVAQLYNAPKEGQMAWSTVPTSGTITPQWHMISSTGPGELQPAFSPDSRRLAFCSHDAGTPQIYLADFPGTKLPDRISKEGGYSPRWRRDGKELFYLSLDGRLISVDLSGSKPWDEKKSIALFPTNTRLAKEAGRLYDVAADGQRFLLIEGGTQISEARIEIVLNWTALLPE